MAEEPIKTAAIISKFFFDGTGENKLGAGEKMAELKKLTAEDKVQLAIGINDGTFSY